MSGLAPSILRNFLRVLDLPDVSFIRALPPYLGLLWQRSVAQQRVEVADNFCYVAKERSSRRCGGTQFAPQEPRQEFLPVFRQSWPAGNFHPFPFFDPDPLDF